MKKTKVTFIKGYHGSDGYMNPGQSFETTADHAKQLAQDGFIEVEPEKEAVSSKSTAKAKESKEAIETKEEKTEGESK